MDALDAQAAALETGRENLKGALEELREEYAKARLEIEKRPLPPALQAEVEANPDLHRLPARPGESGPRGQIASSLEEKKAALEELLMDLRSLEKEHTAQHQRLTSFRYDSDAGQAL